MSAIAIDRPSSAISMRVWKIAGVAALGPLITNLDSTVVNVSLSVMSRDLHARLDVVQWVVSGYLLALALTLPLSGWLVDRFGTKRVYLACFALFTVASGLCGASSSASALISARVLQGMAGGLLAPMAQVMVAREAPQQIAKVMGVMVVPVLLGPIFGPSMAGVILQHASWHWIFFINLPIGVLALLLAIIVLPNDRGVASQRTFDLVGFLLLSPGLVLLLHAQEGVSSHFGIEPFVQLLFALLVLVAFMLHARAKQATALIDLSLFGQSSFAASALTQFFANAVTFGGQVFVPLYLMSVLRMSPGRVGLLLAFSGLGALLSYPSMGRIVERFGSRRVSALGGLIGLIGTLPFALLAESRLSLWAIGAALFVRGVGLGTLSVPAIAAAYSSIAREDIPVATTAVNIVQRLGGPVATTLLTIFLHQMSMRAAGPTMTFGAAPFCATFWFLCGFHALAFATALKLPQWARASSAPTELAE